MKICHLTSVHPRGDMRILHRECASLARNGYYVSLVVADGKADEIISGVSIFGLQKQNGTFRRILKTPSIVFGKALEIDADIYHMHDPELIPIGLQLRKKGKIVFFDAHEDLPKQLKTKPYLNTFFRIVLPIVVSWYEKYACKKFSGIVTATPAIGGKFKRINASVANINNYPILSELANDGSWSKKEKYVCYIGSFAEIRGTRELVRSLGYLKSPAGLKLAGEFDDKTFEREVRGLKEWRRVDDCGYLNRDQVKNILQKAYVGIVTFYPSPNHIEAQPNKLFEYMSAGIPVIASNFPLWKKLVEGHKCGICVNPLDPQEIASAIDYFIFNPKEAEIMGKNGRKAVEEKYNWSIEEKKLLQFYSGFTGK